MNEMHSTLAMAATSAHDIPLPSALTYSDPTCPPAWCNMAYWHLYTAAALPHPFLTRIPSAGCHHAAQHSTPLALFLGELGSCANTHSCTPAVDMGGWTFLEVHF